MVEVPAPGAGMVLGLNFAALMLALNAMDALKPLEIVVVIVDVPELPRLMVSVFGLALMVKSGLPPPLVSELMSVAPFGLPHPVFRSKPLVAGQPLLPTVMSWKFALYDVPRPMVYTAGLMKPSVDCPFWTACWLARAR